MKTRLRRVRRSWTYEIFIVPASPRIGCLMGCPLLIRVSGNKHATGQASMHTLGMWALEKLHAGKERRAVEPHGYNIFDLDPICSWGLDI